MERKDALKGQTNQVSDQKDNAVIEFNELEGHEVTKISGQTRYAYTYIVDEFLDNFPEMIGSRDSYEGSVIKFFDFETSRVYQPFELKENIAYGDVIYLDGSLYFLQDDFNRRISF